VLEFVLACAAPLDPVTLTVVVEPDARNAALELDLVVGNDQRELARAPSSGSAVTLEVPPPETHGTEAYVGVADAGGTWRGAAGSWLVACLEGCEGGTDDADRTDPFVYWRGWNEVSTLYHQPDLPTGENPAGGFSFRVHADHHGDESLDVAIRGGEDVTAVCLQVDPEK
jgi:hypothetical protein